MTSSEITGTTFKISWSGDRRATSYTYSLNGATTVPSNNQGLASKFAVFSGLLYGTQYSVIITATNSVDSTPSAALNVTTGPATVDWTYYTPLEPPRSASPNFTIDPTIIALISPPPPDVIGTATNSTRTFLAALNSDRSVYFSVDSGITWFNSKPANRLLNLLPPSNI